MSKAPSMTELEALADKALDAKLVADEAAEQAADAKAALEAALEAAHKLNPDMKALGHTRIKITPNNYFDVAEGTKFLTKRGIKECTVQLVDPKLVKAHLTPIQLKQAMKAHAKAWKVGIDVLTD